jgi:hypothetical protein
MQIFESRILLFLIMYRECERQHLWHISLAGLLGDNAIKQATTVSIYTFQIFGNSFSWAKAVRA